jgi:hypothetical protein
MSALREVRSKLVVVALIRPRCLDLVALPNHILNVGGRKHRILADELLSESLVSLFYLLDVDILSLYNAMRKMLLTSFMDSSQSLTSDWHCAFC